MPERGGHHVLDVAGFAVGEPDLEFLAGRQWLGGGAGDGGTYGRNGTDGGVWIAGLAVPLGVAEMVVRFYEVVDGEVVLAVVEARAATDDLLELDHRIDGAHQDDVADVAGVHAGGELLRGREDGGDGFFVVLEVAKMLLT